jgi:tRNA(Ile)-lysidine synthase
MPVSRVHKFIAQHNLIPDDSTVILGLSGGPDSVFLFHALLPLHKAGKLTLIAAHFDHGWRAESPKDAQFCRELAQAHGIEFVPGHAQDFKPARKSNGSKEELGRLLRRSFFDQQVTTRPGALIALAHHADDQHETFFIRLLRGSGITGLTGMKPRMGSYVRPLLEVSKQEILIYLEHHAIPYVIDATNESPLFLRNRIRHTLLPALAQCDTRFERTMRNTMRKLNEADEFINFMCEQTAQKAIISTEGKWLLDTAYITGVHPVLQHRLILKWLCAYGVPFTPTDAFFAEIHKFLFASERTAHAIHHEWRIVKHNQCAYIELTQAHTR